MRYAAETEVSSEKSKAEIEGLLSKYGATSFASGWKDQQAVIAFAMCGRQVKFFLPLPAKDLKQFTHTNHETPRLRSEADSHKAWEQATRQRWRALALVVKAKLEAVASGITSFEEEFMAHIVMPDGKTVAEHALPMIAETYKSGKMQPLLAGW